MMQWTMDTWGAQAPLKQEPFSPGQPDCGAQTPHSAASTAETFSYHFRAAPGTPPCEVPGVPASHHLSMTCRYPYFNNNLDPTGLQAAYHDDLSTWSSFDLASHQQRAFHFAATPSGPGVNTPQVMGFTHLPTHRTAPGYTFGLPGGTQTSPTWVSPASTVSRIRRTKRRPYSKLQIMELEKGFQESMYLSRDRRQTLSEALKLTERQVKIWFQNRRMKLKKLTEREKKEQEELAREKQALGAKFLMHTAGTDFR